MIQTNFKYLEDYLLDQESEFILEAYKSYLSSSKEFLKRPFALKCPEYLLFLNDIEKVFSNSTIVWVHRSPYDSILSYCPMIEKSWEFFRGKVDKKEIVDFIACLYKKMILRAMESRKNIKNRIVDVSYSSLINDREQLIIDLNKQIQSSYSYKSKGYKANKKSESFYVNKYKFNSKEYEIDLDVIKKDFSFYYEEYREYL